MGRALYLPCETRQRLGGDFTSCVDRAPMAQLVEHRAVTREIAGSNPRRINIENLKITEEKVLPL